MKKPHLPRIPLKSPSKSSFFRLVVEIRFWSCNLCSHCAYFYCVLQLSLCRSQWNGCVKVPRCCGCERILLCFAAQRRKSYCSGCVKVANGALAAGISQFWRILCSSFSVQKLVVCKSFSVQKLALCKSSSVQKLSVCKSFSVQKLALCKSFSV